MWHAGGPAQCWVYDQSKSNMLTIQPDETHLGRFSENKIYRCTLIWNSHAQPRRYKDDALCCCGLFLHTTCQTGGRKWLPAGLRGAVSSVSCVRDELITGTHILYVYIHTHAHKTCLHTRPTGACHHQWHKPSVVVFRLHWALLMQCVPYNGTHFHFHPRTAAPPFCSSHLHRSLCTHNM